MFCQFVTSYLQFVMIIFFGLREYNSKIIPSKWQLFQFLTKRSVKFFFDYMYVSNAQNIHTIIM